MNLVQASGRHALGIATAPQVGTHEISSNVYREQMELKHTVDAESRARNSGADGALLEPRCVGEVTASWPACWGLPLHVSVSLANQSQHVSPSTPLVARTPGGPTPYAAEYVFVPGRDPAPAPHHALPPHGERAGEPTGKIGAGGVFDPEVYVRQREANAEIHEQTRTKRFGGGCCVRSAGLSSRLWRRCATHLPVVCVAHVQAHTRRAGWAAPSACPRCSSGARAAALTSRLCVCMARPSQFPLAGTQTLSRPFRLIARAHVYATLGRLRGAAGAEPSRSAPFATSDGFDELRRRDYYHAKSKPKGQDSTMAKVGCRG